MRKIAPAMKNAGVSTHTIISTTWSMLVVIKKSRRGIKIYPRDSDVQTDDLTGDDERTIYTIRTEAGAHRVLYCTTVPEASERKCDT
jgi:hypothetical protein